MEGLDEICRIWETPRVHRLMTGEITQEECDGYQHSRTPILSPRTFLRRYHYSFDRPSVWLFPHTWLHQRSVPRPTSDASVQRLGSTRPSTAGHPYTSSITASRRPYLPPMQTVVPRRSLATGGVPLGQRRVRQS